MNIARTGRHLLRLATHPGRLAFAIFGLIALSQVTAIDASAHSLAEVEQMLSSQEQYLQVVHQPAPAFTLQDAENHSVQLQDYRGKVVVLYFIYVSCPDECPLQSEKLAEVQKAVNATPMRDRVQFLAITTDPERDNADVLRGYGALHGLNPGNWTILTSGADRPSATRDLANEYGLKFTPGDNGELMHGVVTHLIDKSGNIRARYHGLNWANLNMVLFINALTNDTH